MKLKIQIQDYLEFCQYEKNLNLKTIKAYRIDMEQFRTFCEKDKIADVVLITKNEIRKYIKYLHETYKTKTIKRKIASIKGFIKYMMSEEVIGCNPFSTIETHFKEEKVLPKIVSKFIVEKILEYQYKMYRTGEMTPWARRYLLRDIVIIELLFATGVRVSELCSIRPGYIDIYNMSVLIKGKCAKERIIQISNGQIEEMLKKYMREFSAEIKKTGYLFVTKNTTRFSEQAARAMIRKYRDKIGETIKLTPHMFRHAFATYLLEEDVDIRYIQKMLGHSSISTTQMYCYVSMEKQRKILAEKHPRNRMVL